MSKQKKPGNGTNRLPIAIIKHAQGNRLLDPMDAIEGSVATITFEGMEETTITLNWEIKGQDEPRFLPIKKKGSVSGTVEIDIPWQRIGTCIGHTVLIWYTAKVGGQHRSSEILELGIQGLKNEDLKSSLPVFAHAAISEFHWQLKMHDFSGDETVRVKAWPFIQAEQRLFVYVTGQASEPTGEFTWLAYDHVVTEAEAHDGYLFEFTLSRNWMAALNDRSQLSANCGVIFDGSDPVPAIPAPIATSLPENAHEFKPGTAVMLRVDPVRSESDNFDSYPTSEFQLPGKVIDTRLLTLQAAGNSAARIGLHLVRTEGELEPGMVEGKSLAVVCGGGTGTPQSAFMRLKWKCTRVKFASSSHGDNSVSFTFFDEHGKRLGEREVNSSAWVEFEVVKGDFITRIDIRSTRHSSIDSLTIWHLGVPNTI
jgi:hypothetical protein